MERQSPRVSSWYIRARPPELATRREALSLRAAVTLQRRASRLQKNSAALVTLVSGISDIFHLRANYHM